MKVFISISLVFLLGSSLSAEPSAVRTLQSHTGSVMCVTFSPDGQILASSSRDHTIKFWNPATGALLKTLSEHSADVYCITFSPKGDLFATCSGDKTILLWNAKTCKIL